ncbi:MAG: sugar phosphate isomerase/epimerase [Lachnospiraceae bacterium]|nr:sugar phosphate isomerase/epimerase [Lachnospiraceae bacterium]
MKLGVMTDLGAKSADDWAAKQIELGCEAVSFPINCEADEKDITAYKEAADRAGLVIAEVGVWRNTLAVDLEERSRMIDYAADQLSLAERIGARCCVNVAGTPHGPRWDGGYAGNFDAETRRDIISMVRNIIDRVEPKNTKFTLEPMPWMVPSGPDDYLRLLGEVERDGFGVHLDLINMVTSPERYFHLDEFMDECFEKLGDKICSIHLKDIRLLEDYTFQLKECACGEGIMNIKRYLEKATAVREDMPVIIEHLNSDEEYRRSFAYVRSL